MARLIFVNIAERLKKMIEVKKYKKGYSPSALQRRYELTYEQGVELATELQKLDNDVDYFSG